MAHTGFISELVYRDPAVADQVLTQLSNLLRHLFARPQHEHSLADELALLKEYMGIQQTLLAERLQMHWPDADALADVQVPTLVLQPLLENAVSHGIAKLRQGGRIDLKIRAEKAQLLIVVENDCPAEQSTRSQGGLGLSNTRARLQALYDDTQQLQLEFLNGARARLTLRMPLRRPARQ